MSNLFSERPAKTDGWEEVLDGSGAPVADERDVLKCAWTKLKCAWTNLECTWTKLSSAWTNLKFAWTNLECIYIPTLCVRGLILERTITVSSR